MTPQLWSRVKQVVELAAESPTEVRAQALAEACGGDEAMRAHAESLLKFEVRARSLDRGFECAALTQDAESIKRAGPYRIERLLGSGGMGEVYLGVRDDDQYRSQVAIKVIHKWAGPETRNRFLTERQILAELKHPNIARLLDGGTLPDGHPYLVMDYIDGQRIDAWSRELQLDVAAVLSLFRKVCAAVQFAHESFIVHRDLKAGNILVTADGEPHLLDFGIAKLLAPGPGDAETTQPGQWLLTPSSASPEQVSGGPITTASDVYALGILLYLLLTGRPAYEGSPHFASDPMRAVREYEPPPMSQIAGIAPGLRHRLRGDLDNIVSKAIEKDPGRRYRTVEEFALDLLRFSENRPIAARPATLNYRARKFVSRNRVPVFVAGLLALGVCGGVAGTVWNAVAARHAQARAERRFESLRLLTNSMLFDIDSRIENLPGGEPARRAILGHALEYLAQMAADSGSDPGVLRDLATAWQRAAAIAHAGGPAQWPVAIESLDKAHAILASLAASAPNDRPMQMQLLSLEWNIANEYWTQGNLKQAALLHRARLDKMERLAAADPVHDADWEYRHRIGISAYVLAGAELDMGHADAALVFARRALEAFQSIHDAAPADPLWQRNTIVPLCLVGEVLISQGRYREAEEKLRSGLAIAAKIVAALPQDGVVVSAVAGLDMDVCEALAHDGRYDDAIAECRQAVALTENSSRAQVEDRRSAAAAAAANASLSLALDLAGKSAEALQSARTASRYYRAAETPGSAAKAAAFPTNPILSFPGSANRGSGSPAGVRAFNNPRERMPGTVNFACERARNLVRLASLETRLGQPGRAAEDLAKARKELGAAAQRSPDHAGIAALLRETNE